MLSSFTEFLLQRLPFAMAIDAPLLCCTESVLYFLFTQQGSTPIAVAKVARNPLVNGLLKKECASAEEGNRLFSGNAMFSAPAVLHSGSWKNFFYYVQEYAAGYQATTQFATHMAWWQRDNSVAAFFDVLELLRVLQSAGHFPPTPLRSFNCRADIVEYRAIYSCSRDELDALALIESDLEELGDVLIPAVPCHGDFTMGNILWNEHKLFLIDWRYYRSSYHPLFDATTFCISLLGVIEQGAWIPLWSKGPMSSRLVELLQQFLDEVSRLWGLDRRTSHLLTRASCCTLALRGFRDSGVVRGRDNGWRETLLWLHKNIMMSDRRSSGADLSK